MRGYHKTEGRAFAGGACDPDLPVVGLDDMFDNGEPESGPANLAASPLVHTVEPLKYPGDIFIRDADPGILYIHPQVVVLTPCDHPDCPLIRILDGIINKIDDDLLKADLIRHHLWQAFLDLSG